MTNYIPKPTRFGKVVDELLLNKNLSADSINQQLEELFNSSYRRLMIFGEIEFIEVWNPVFNKQPVKHRAFLDKKLNPELLETVSIYTPFSNDSRRLPLVGIEVGGIGNLQTVDYHFLPIASEVYVSVQLDRERLCSAGRGLIAVTAHSILK
jgi:hypothetical protein